MTWSARPGAGWSPSSSVTFEQIYARKKAADKELEALVAATGTGLRVLLAQRVGDVMF